MFVVDDLVLKATISLVGEYLARNPLPPDMVPALIAGVYTCLENIVRGAMALPATPSKKVAPAVPVGESLMDECIICLEDGSKHKMMKGYLMRKFGLTPNEYRAKWGLPQDYPMTAPGYSEVKRREARTIGLGTAANKRGVKRGPQAG